MNPVSNFFFGAALFLLGLAVVIVVGKGMDKQCSEVSRLDVNRDGKEDLVDLSVLAAELNARNQMQDHGQDK